MTTKSAAKKTELRRTEGAARPAPTAKQQRTSTISFKVSDKGGVSVYGLGRFPVTLYYEQWTRLLATAQDLTAFLEQNKEAGKLKMKEEA